MKNFGADITGIGIGCRNSCQMRAVAETDFQTNLTDFGAELQRLSGIEGYLQQKGFQQCGFGLADAAAFTLLKEQLVEVLSTLTPREEKVLKLRFGIEDGRTRTLEEVGKEFNVTRERIRQIEAKALRKLRHPSRSKKLKDFLN